MDVRTYMLAALFTAHANWDFGLYETSEVSES